MQSDAATVTDYLAQLPDDRRAAISAVRDLILEHLPEGFVEVMNWGAISYEVPLEVYPDTYNKKPLMYVGLASQKRHMAVYLCGIYGDPELKADIVERWKATGKRLDMGASCIRFKKLDHLALDLVAEAVSAISMVDFVARAKAVQAARKK
jgi:uncharacterized protein YdhG (YjbR/CyaY superfamily)